MKKPFAAVIIILHFMPALFAQVTINANLTATAGQNQITAYSINKNLIIDGCAGVSVPQYVCNSTGINAAYSALVSAGGGTLYIPASTVTISSTVTFTSPTVQVVGAGSSATIFNCTVNGDCINTRTNPFTIGPGTVLEGITLVGQGSSTPNAVGIHTGDMVGGRFSDIQIDNFTGTNSSCFWVDNQHGWFERNYISNLELGMHGPGSNEDGCTKELRLTNSDSSDGNSFGYNTWIGLRFASEGNSQTWISYESGNVYSNFIQASGNLGNVSSTSATLFSVQGTDRKSVV